MIYKTKNKNRYKSVKYYMLAMICVAFMVCFSGCTSSPTEPNRNEPEPAVITMTTTNQSVTLRIKAVNEITINWGDGSTSTGSRAQGIIDITHEYENDSTHTIKIHGEVTYLDASNNGLTSLLTSNNNALTLLNISLNDLSATALNELFRSLNTKTGSKHLYIMENPGAVESDNLIAESKGWMVHTDNVNEAPAVTMNTTLSSVSFIISAISDFIVDWGDGNKFTGGSINDWNDVRHTYQNQATHTISIYGKITQLRIGFGSLSDLDLSNASMLSGFGISGSNLGYLDISNNWLLQVLGLHNNRLTSLDTSNNPLLRTIIVGNMRSAGAHFNQITKLDLRNNVLLESLDAFANQLIDIDITNNSSLHTLLLDDNRLTSIDVSNNPLLSRFNVGVNRLTTIDLSNNPRLGYLQISNNLLTSLDVSNNPLLGILYASRNMFESLDLSNNPQLWRLEIDDNQLSDFDASIFTRLERIHIRNNLFSTDSLNELFHTLHENYIIFRRIRIGGNPGSDDCDRSIATAKGWDVRD